jgi:hypothetical protein
MNIAGTHKWCSQMFNSIADGTYELDAIGYRNVPGTCDGTVSSDTTITVSHNSTANTCCVGAVAAPLAVEYEGEKRGITVRSFAQVLDKLEDGRLQVVHITVDNDEVPYVAFGGSGPENAKVSVLFGPKRVALHVKQHEGQWNALRENVAVNQEYPVEVTVDGAKESLLLKVERGKIEPGRGASAAGRVPAKS